MVPGLSVINPRSVSHISFYHKNTSSADISTTTITTTNFSEFLT